LESGYRIFLPQFFAATTENELTFFTRFSQSGELGATAGKQWPKDGTPYDNIFTTYCSADFSRLFQSTGFFILFFCDNICCYY
jgi:hypothetical protein